MGREADCLPRFPDAAGWLGGDAAYSVPLPSRLSSDGEPTSLWLFGDTFVTRREAAGQRTYPFIHNSIGLSKCRDGGEWTLATYWRRFDTGEATAFFAPDPNAKWHADALARSNNAPYYWLFDGFVAHDTLFVGLLRVVHSEPRGALNLPFRLLGMDLARIENPRDPPDEWRIQLIKLSDDPIAFPGSSFVVSGDHLYAFMFFDRNDGRSPRALTRIHLRHLRGWRSDLSEYFETLGREGGWEDGFLPDRAKILMADDATEMSVHFDPILERWLAIYTSPSPPDEADSSGTILIRSALALEGPWSKPLHLFTIPETAPKAGPEAGSKTDGRGDENKFCYAAKAHPQFAPAGRLLITYVCSLFARDENEVGPVLERLANSLELYRAKAVSLPVPEMLVESSTHD